MATDILMPKMGESVQEGTILRWLKKPGDKVERDEIIAEISTDKVDTEIPSPAAGTLVEIVAQENATVGVGEVIARLGAEGEQPVAPVASPAQAPPVDKKATPQQPAPAQQSPAPSQSPAPPAPPAAQPEPQPGEMQTKSGIDAAAAPSAGGAGADATTSGAGPGASGERTPILMPKMGESVQEGTILRWLKKPGDHVDRDEIIAEISTDKVDTEIPSPSAGTLVEIAAQENETVEVGAVIAYLGGTATGAAQTAAASAAAPASREAPQPPASAPQQGANGAAPHQIAAPPRSADTSALQAAEAAGPVPRKSGDRFYSPLVRSIAEKEGIGVGELDALKGTGAGGRVTKDDLLGYVKDRPARSGQQPTARAAAPAAPAISSTPRPAAPQAVTAPGEEFDVVPMDRMRQLIAEHMVRSKHTSPHVTEVGEADVTPLVRLRDAQKEEFKKRNGINLTFTPFFVAAIARALRDNPWVNGSVDGTNVIVKKHINVGVATALPDGNLIVPVIRDADRMNITGLAHAVSDLATRARSKQLTPDDIAGGTFTLTNYGVFGLLHGAPIINQPQVAILGTGVIQKRPVVREIDAQDVIVARSMIYLSLSHDHRVVDGLLGGKFLADVIRYLEEFNADTAL